MSWTTNYKQLWNEWEVRLCVASSLLLQIYLIFFAPLRERKSKTAEVSEACTWLAYLLADAVATFSLGQLSNTIRTPKIETKATSPSPSPDDRIYNDKYNDLLAFWAPFLLLHLGGPDTITAFALEDNELWLRHFLYLGVHLFAGGYVFLRSFPNSTLIIPTLLLFVAGTIKYVERTVALYLASENGFKRSIPRVPDPGTNYAMLIDEYTLNSLAGLPTEISIPDDYPVLSSIERTEEEEEENREVRRAVMAYEFFGTFKRIITDLLLSFNERNRSRDFLLHQSADDAFTMVDMELRLAYDILYTKAAVVQNQYGCPSRSICFFSILAAALFFFLKFNADDIHQQDLAVTYTLLGGALTLEVVGLTNLIFSPWMFALLVKKNHLPTRMSFIRKFAIKGKRSIYISQYNLITACMWHQQSKGKCILSRILCKTEFITRCKVVSHELVCDRMIAFLFDELKRKSKYATDFKKTRHLASCRGSWALEQRACYRLLGWTVEVAFEESILLWHIATDLCLYTSLSQKQQTEPQDPHALPSQTQQTAPQDPHALPSQTQQTEPQDPHALPSQPQQTAPQDPHALPSQTQQTAPQDPDAIPIYIATRRLVSKRISEYMLYLLMFHPSMISLMEGIRQIKHHDAYEEAMSFINNRNDIKTAEVAREKLQELSSEMPSRSKLVLFDACTLVKNLNSLKERRKWEIISEVWAELLSYAATHCRGKYHAEGLIRGGELLTYVWFLMVHMGLGQQYHEVSGHASAKLVVPT
ncbi:hypothetical protein AAC387_Pa06g3131 [Persea americana]